MCVCIFHDKDTNNIIGVVCMCVSEVLSWRRSFVVCEEDEMMQKFLICAIKFPVQEAYLPRPEWGAAVLSGSCFSYCTITTNGILKVLFRY